MQVSELEKNSKVIDLVITIDKLEEASEVNGTPIQEAIASDKTGQIKITFWLDEVGKFKEGDKIIMSTGWCKEFQDELQISSGKYGKIKLIPPEKQY